jgi:uncharacterized cupin superfamily protein
VIPEAKVENGVPQGEGWFVLNARDAEWLVSKELGSFCPFESEDVRFTDYGINLNVLPPGQPNCMYHAEEAQEDFLVLAGECLLIVEGEERPLAQWDFVHCPPWTEHVFVGTGERPCLLLAVGARGREGLRYPVNETAARHGASVERYTELGSEAYARFERPQPGPTPDVF